MRPCGRHSKRIAVTLAPGANFSLDLWSVDYQFLWRFFVRPLRTVHRIGVDELDRSRARAWESEHFLEDSVQGVGRDGLVTNLLATTGVKSDEAPIVQADSVINVWIRLGLDQLVV